MLTTKPQRSRERYAAPVLIARGDLMGLTRDTWDTGDNDNGMPPLDCFAPAGSVGFVL